MGLRYIAPAGAAVAATALLTAPGMRGMADDAVAQGTNRSQVRDVLAQLRRNSKVSERLNAAFFRAPQTRQYTGTAFKPLGRQAYNEHPDHSLQLAPDRGCFGEGCSQVIPNPTATFHLTLDVPNRARVIGVGASYRDAAGNNNDTPSGLGFSVLEMGLLGDNQKQLLELPAGSDPALGLRSRDGGSEALHALPLRDGGFRVDNSRKRYVIQVRLDDSSEHTRFHGITIRYVLGGN